MFKLIITGLIVYGLYKMFFGQAALGSGPLREKRRIDPNTNRQEAEYTDYEEVD